jgi:16S rRNA processing protein RimM
MIKEILQTNANDIWVIRGKLAKDLLIPYIDQVVKEINIKEKKIIIQPIPGLLD